jgi:hypothetical protein
MLPNLIVPRLLVETFMRRAGVGSRTETKLMEF